MPDKLADQDQTAQPEADLGSPATGASGVKNDFLVVGDRRVRRRARCLPKLLAALPANIGMAFILVQHLDPTHESMMVDLLAQSHQMTVLQATDGMPIEREHLYIIPPGPICPSLTACCTSRQPQARHGARLPFDFLLHSLAADRGSVGGCA